MRRGLLLSLILLMLIGLPGSGLAQLNDDYKELQGIIDIHAHVGPATELSISRTLDAIEAAQLAQRHGMRAINLKQHYLETASWAYLVSRVVPGIKVFGGIALNRSVDLADQSLSVSGNYGLRFGRSQVSHIFDPANHKARLRRVGDEDILLYDIPWQGHSICSAVRFHVTAQPRCVHFWLNARSSPPASRTTIAGSRGVG